MYVICYIHQCDAHTHFFIWLLCEVPRQIDKRVWASTSILHVCTHSWDNILRRIGLLTNNTNNISIIVNKTNVFASVCANAFLIYVNLDRNMHNMSAHKLHHRVGRGVGCVVVTVSVVCTQRVLQIAFDTPRLWTRGNLQTLYVQDMWWTFRWSSNSRYPGLHTRT